MRAFLYLFILSFFFTNAKAQTAPAKQLPAKRTTAAIKIDGSLDEAVWKDVLPAKDFVEWRPNPGAVEASANRTEVYLLYDNTSIYIGGYCHERTKDSISKELIGRDKVGVNDFVGVIFDTYFDKINAVGFYVTPYGEQFDAKYSSGEKGEDDSWNAVWDSEAKIVSDGWTFEMRIPYSALRFTNRDVQTWGMNLTRKRNKTGQQYMWNPVDPKKNGFINQEGSWTGLEKIESPLRLSFSPYLSTYINHYPAKDANIKDVTASVNGGMDVKYGISESFTLDMTLIPDFGQVQSDNQVLNLSPFEVKYNENRSFFTEGTELFNKGDLFYSRRIGSTPLHYYDVQNGSSTYPHINSNEHFLKNPSEAKLINATKVSGRTKNGLGIGFFNAITKPMYAQLEDDAGSHRKLQTASLTNYNIVVLDQTLKNNSSISFINTNVLRNGQDYDANVSAALFDINNKKNTYNWAGKFSVSDVTDPGAKKSLGYSHNLSFGKTSGRWNFQLTQEVTDANYDINDMGILFNNNFIDHSLWTGYKWVKPGKWFNSLRMNLNVNYSRLYNRLPGQKLASNYQSFRTNFRANAQLKNLWFVGAFVGYLPKGNDFYEAHVPGYSFISPQHFNVNGWFETNSAKKYSLAFNYFEGFAKQFSERNIELNFSQQYRFSDKFSLNQQLNFNPQKNNAGYYKLFFENGIMKEVIFSRRNRNTVENLLNAKYNFNNKSGITLRARHYWSKVEPQQLYDLNSDGSLSPTRHTGIAIQNRNFNSFNIDAVYTLQFAPGSFINIVWKNSIYKSDNLTDYHYFKNFGQTVEAPQNNNLSLKILYYLDYLDFKKWHKRR